MNFDSIPRRDTFARRQFLTRGYFDTEGMRIKNSESNKYIQKKKQNGKLIKKQTKRYRNDGEG